MTEAEAVAALDAIQPDATERTSDPEAAHSVADGILLEFVPEAVRAAFGRVDERVGGFWYA